MKTGVYFCNCGTIISDKIDAEKVRLKIEATGAVAYFKTFGFLCSEDGKDYLANDLKMEQPDRVIVAACSPRDHEQTFMRAMTAAGLNPYLMQMVNIREQVAWVTKKPEEATSKAATAIRGAVAGVALQEPLEKKELRVSPNVLIIGGGPAGIKAAMTLAEAGRKVTLVEKTPVLGGMPVRYEELFPTMECGPCMLEPIMAEVMHGEYAENIEILTMSELQEVAGYYGNFIVKIRQSPRYVDTAQCIGCCECLEPCPVSAQNSFNCNLDERKAIYFPFLGALPNAPSIDPAVCTRFTEGSDCQACSDACPMGEGVVNFADCEQIHERNVGAIIIAIGSTLYDCSRFPKLGYGTLPNIRTSAEFERVLASNGPSGGTILTSSGTEPASVAIIHCVGSLDERHCEYCSGICCQYAFKFNHMIASRLPEAKIYHFYKELVIPGKEEFALYHHARHNPNSRFVRYDNIDELSITGDGDSSSIEFQGKEGCESVSADLIILCPAIVPAEATNRLGNMLEVSRDSSGFFEELHGRMDSSKTKIKGVYLAGTCQSPMDIQKANSQGMAAAGYILSELAEGKRIELDPITAVIDEARCAGCRVCISVCPYKAVSFNAEKEVSEVNSVLCQGCGTCVAACPAGSIKGNHFTNEIIMAEIGEMLS